MGSKEGLKRLQEYHKEIALARVCGYSRKEIVEKFNQHISSLESLDRVLRDPLFQEYVDKLREKRNDAVIDHLVEADKMISEAMPKAAELLVAKMESAKNESNQLKAIFGILHIGGLKPKVREDEKPNVTPVLKVTEVHHYLKKEAG